MLLGPASPWRVAEIVSARWGSLKAARSFKYLLLGRRLDEFGLIPTLCDKTVSESDLFTLLVKMSSEEQIPHVAVSIRIRRNGMELLEPIPIPWAQGVGRSSP